jgi:hypothetical protein
LPRASEHRDVDELAARQRLGARISLQPLDRLAGRRTSSSVGRNASRITDGCRGWFAALGSTRATL